MSTWGVDRNVPKTSYMWHLCRFPESTWMSHILEICDKNVTYIGNMWPYCYIFSIYVTFMSIRGIDINVTYMTFWAHFCQLPKLTWMSHICVYSTFIPRFPKRQQWRLFHVFITFLSIRKYPPCKGQWTSQGWKSVLCCLCCTPISCCWQIDEAECVRSGMLNANIGG